MAKIRAFSRAFWQEYLFHPQRWVRLLALGTVCIATALLIGAITGLLGALLGSAALIGLVLIYAALRHLQVGFWALVGIIFLLPFAAFPIDIGFSPTFLDLALVGVYFVWISRIVAHQEERFIAPSPSLGVFAFAMMAIVSFVAGLGHAPLTANILRRFFEVVLGISFFFVVVNAVRTPKELRAILRVIIVAASAAAAIGIVLYVLPQPITIRLLSALRVVRYPSGPDVLRFIEDNPELPLRATSTSIDPNVLGGALIFATTITVAQSLGRRPVLPRPWLILGAALMGACLILTFSRGSFVGLAAALGLLGLLRHRRLLWIGLLALGVMVLLPPTRVYIEHFIAGVRGEDLATQMRFGEYKDALILISRHPWLGVGFAGTPEVDTYLGVSNVYLLIAEEMGILGVALFVATLGTLLGSFFAIRRRLSADSPLEPIVYGTSLAILGGLVGGLFDHYLFNLAFPHATVLLWMTAGLSIAAMRMAKAEGAQAAATSLNHKG